MKKINFVLGGIVIFWLFSSFLLGYNYIDSKKQKENKEDKESISSIAVKNSRTKKDNQEEQTKIDLKEPDNLENKNKIEEIEEEIRVEKEIEGSNETEEKQVYTNEKKEEEKEERDFKDKKEDAMKKWRSVFKNNNPPETNKPIIKIDKEEKELDENKKRRNEKASKILNELSNQEDEIKEEIEDINSRTAELNEIINDIYNQPDNILTIEGKASPYESELNLLQKKKIDLNNLLIQIGSARNQVDDYADSGVMPLISTLQFLSSLGISF
ncbi:MAG: hypothetical protein U5L10_01175 [Candidatus Moranbacteria bacterium]|nr:hypothetical protein [Candidatus Moranbacteria bacterium]